jgi:hypothetical protein
VCCCWRGRGLKTQGCGRGTKQGKSERFNGAMLSACWCRLEIGQSLSGLRSLSHLIQQERGLRLACARRRGKICRS